MKGLEVGGLKHRKLAASLAFAFPFKAKHSRNSTANESASQKGSLVAKWSERFIVTSGALFCQLPFAFLLGRVQ